MPTIVLRHVSKHYATGESRETAGLNQVVSAGTRTAFDEARSTEAEPARAHPDPSDRDNALDNLSLTIRNGETLCVLGPSGCGKTTLLKVIAGLVKPDSGDVFYDSTPIQNIPIGERGIGMVFQNYALYPHLPARDNIGFFDLVRKQPEKIPERLRTIHQVMGVELEHLLSRKPPTLSGGEQQRVAIARCLARDPQVFLFDEPLSNLDAKLRVETRLQLKRLLRHYQITSVYVTHDQTEAIALADRIAIMRAGKIEQLGTFQTLYETPLNAFVAQFFGTPPMNLFAGHAGADAWEGQGFSVSPIRPALKRGQALWLGIRPEHVRLADDGIPAKIEFIEPLFNERRQIVYMRLAGQRCLASLGLDLALEVNTTVHVQFPTDSLYLFDQKTEARVG
jgi:ABC-type sugar transport system ATPase subunit